MFSPDSLSFRVESVLFSYWSSVIFWCVGNHVLWLLNSICASVWEGAGDWSQSLTHARNASYLWACLFLLSVITVASWSPWYGAVVIYRKDVGPHKNLTKAWITVTIQIRPDIFSVRVESSYIHLISILDYLGALVHLSLMTIPMRKLTMGEEWKQNRHKKIENFM